MPTSASTSTRPADIVERGGSRHPVTLPSTPRVLTFNGGSSSLRFAVFACGPSPRRLLAGKIDRIERARSALIVTDAAGAVVKFPVSLHRDPNAAGRSLLDWIETQSWFSQVRAIGHRVVHGLRHPAPARVTPQLLRELHRLTPYDPDHLPTELALIEACRLRFPQLHQVACFDTVFHRTMPRIARLLPLPRRFQAKGVMRYGFHGLSYTYLLEELARVAPAAARGRVLFAHLGSGASLAAVYRGQCIDTSMGFTPASGLMMGTRSGDLDPGVGPFLARHEHLSPAKFQQIVNHESGLLGVSGTSADLRALLAREATDPHAAEAVALFCYQARKWIGAFAAVLGGVDTLVFSGGIGENSPVIRARICTDLGFLGIGLDPRKNARGAPVISQPTQPVTVRVIPTDEEQMIARSTCRTLGLGHR